MQMCEVAAPPFRKEIPKLDLLVLLTHLFWFWLYFLIFKF